MKITHCFAASTAAWVVMLFGLIGPVRADSTTDIVDAANSFLASLTPEQRRTVMFAYDDAEQRARWSNFPTGFVPRGGMSLKQMTVTQRESVMRLLSVMLSPRGLAKVNEIRQADDDFKANGSKQGPRGGGPPVGGPRGAGPPPGGLPPGAAHAGPPSGDMFGSDLYYVSFLGTPSTGHPWMLQFGGHHLALNITMAGGQGVLTPSLTGAQPASFTSNGHIVRPLGRESDQALALLRALDDDQRRQAILPYIVSDLALGPGQDGKTVVAEGLKVSAMTSRQQAMLLGLIGEWAGIINDSSAAARMNEMKADLDATWFAWSGPTTGASGENISAYYRIQGPHLVIEYAPQHDEPTNHVHTMYRDPTNDYGRGVTSR